MEITLQKLQSIVEANLVAFKVKGYEYNDDGATETEGENLKDPDELSSWIKRKVVVREDIIVNEDTGEAIEDPASDIVSVSLFDNNTNLRDAIARSIYDALVDTTSDGSALSDPNTETYGGGDRTQGSGTLLLQPPTGKTLKIVVEDTTYEFTQEGLWIDHELVLAKPPPL